MRQGLSKKEERKVKSLMAAKKMSDKEISVTYNVSMDYVKELRKLAANEKKVAAQKLKEDQVATFEEIKPLIVKLIDQKLRGYQKKGA